MAIGESDARIAALNKAIIAADDKTAAFIQALAGDVVKTAGGKVFIVCEGKAIDQVSGQAVVLPNGAEDVISNNRMRGELDGAQAVLKLFSKDDKLRGDAIASLPKDPDESKLVLLDKALAAEVNPDLKAKLGLARAAAMLGSSDTAMRLQSAKALAESKDPATQLLLNERVKLEPDAQVKAQLQASLARIKSSLGLGETLGVVFTGISLGSILLLAAPGLAITNGPMGVINMAHGELIMVGAYATYVVQTLFRQ